MNYNHEDFSGCLFNPFEKKFFAKYERLLDYSTDERLMKYVVAMYDSKSPLVREISDLRQRKQTAAVIAGYDLLKDEDYLEEITNFRIVKDEEDSPGAVAFSLVDKFLKEVIHSRLWYMICAREQTVYEYASRMLKPISQDADKDEKKLIDATVLKSKLSNDMDDIEKLLQQNYDQLYGNDEHLKKISVRRNTPEARAGNV